MISLNYRRVLIGAAAAAALSGMAWAAAPATAPAAPAGASAPMGGMHEGMDGMQGGMRGMRGKRGGRGMEGGMGMMHPLIMATRKLDLTADQQQRIRSIMETAHQQMMGKMQDMGANLVVLGNPGDPGYAAAVQDAKSRAAAMVQHHSDIDVQVYSLLTAEQKSKLPQVLAEMKTRLDEHKGQWQQRRGGGKP